MSQNLGNIFDEEMMLLKLKTENTYLVNTTLTTYIIILRFNHFIDTYETLSFTHYYIPVPICYVYVLQHLKMYNYLNGYLP